MHGPQTGLSNPLYRAGHPLSQTAHTGADTHASLAVRQVGGNSGPQTLYRTGLFVAAPEQYPIQCPNGDCRTINATALALQQQASFADNARVDARFGLDHWPLFFVGQGVGPNASAPDNATKNVRSDSLVRWMAYSAIAYGAKALNWYCWGGGIYYYNSDPRKAGRPSPIYHTVREVNADATAWGDELLGGGYGFVGALHTGATNAHDGGGVPSSRAVVTAMDDSLLVGVFTQDSAGEASTAPLGRNGARPNRVAAAMPQVAKAEAPDVYLFVVDKRVSGEVGMVPPRNVTLTLHPSVGSVSVASPGMQGARGFDELRSGFHGAKRRSSPALAPALRRVQRSHVEHWAEGEEEAAAEGAAIRVGPRAAKSTVAIRVTVELVGGGGALIRLHAADAPSAGAALRDASTAMVNWSYDPGSVTMQVAHAPAWAFDSWHARYRPYEGLELTAGRVCCASPPPTGPLDHTRRPNPPQVPCRPKCRVVPSAVSSQVPCRLTVLVRPHSPQVPYRPKARPNRSQVPCHPKCFAVASACADRPGHSSVAVAHTARAHCPLPGALSSRACPLPYSLSRTARSLRSSSVGRLVAHQSAPKRLTRGSLRASTCSRYVRQPRPPSRRTTVRRPRSALPSIWATHLGSS